MGKPKRPIKKPTRQRPDASPKWKLVCDPEHKDCKAVKVESDGRSNTDASAAA